MDAFIQIQYKCSNNLGGICKSFTTVDSCLELKKKMLCKKAAACKDRIRNLAVSDAATKRETIVLLSPHGHELVHGHKARPVTTSQTEQWHFPVKSALAGL